MFFGLFTSNYRQYARTFEFASFHFSDLSDCSILDLNTEKLPKLRSKFRNFFSLCYS